jgi:hypothetical protein
MNFGSRSLAYAGHQYTDDAVMNELFEREYYFANMVHGSPAYKSYEETLADKAIDSYDGLYADIFQGVGRSGSELIGMLKMLIAGGNVPRDVKNLLKAHGMWAAALLLLYKMSLPYVDEDGNEVGFASELRHRPAYSSYGDYYAPPDTEFILHNLSYIEYDEGEHIRRMVAGARAMTTPPPITIVEVVDLTVTDDTGQVIVDHAATDPRIMSAQETSIRVWGRPGETLTLRVDLGQSYDLLDRYLFFALASVYAAQGVTIQREGCSSIFALTVGHDPGRPKGRIPVVARASADDGTGGTPAFVNFYWPEPGQVEDPPHFHPDDPGRSNDPLHEVNRNLRPVVTLDPAPNVAGAADPTVRFAVPAGTPVSVQVSCSDPEGYPTRLYQWSTDEMKLSNGVVSYTPSAGEIEPSAHIICTDHTGATGSAWIYIEVQ